MTVQTQLSDTAISLLTMLEQANATLRAFLFPGTVIQLRLAAERRIIVIRVRFDDGDDMDMFISAVFANHYVVAATAHAGFLVHRVHSVSSEVWKDWNEDEALYSDIGASDFYVNAPGFVGVRAQPSNDLARAEEDKEAHIADGRRLV